MPDPERPLDFVAIGRAAVDLYGEQIGGRLEDMASFAKYVGGCPANISIGAARLGLKPAIITRVGDEHMGRFVRETLAAEGVDVSHVATDPARLTGLVILGIRDQQTFPLIFFRENCADMAIDAGDIDAAFIASAKALVVTGTHFSTEKTNAASHAAIGFARAAGTKVVLDIDYRPNLWGLAGHGAGESRFVASSNVSEHLQKIVPDCDLIVGTEEEVHIAGGSTDTMAALKWLRQLSSATIVMKLGPQGCVVFDGPVPDRIEGGLMVNGFPVEVFNVLGAGDGFMAGLLRGWLRGADWRQSCRIANASGALVVSRHGCAPAMPSWTELEQFLDRAERSDEPMRLHADADLARLHRVTTGRRDQPQLFVVGVDHVAPFADLARSSGRSTDDIRRFKTIVAEAVANIAKTEPHVGLIVDGDLGRHALEQAAGQDHWLARPVEDPRQEHLSLVDGQDAATTLRAWPTRVAAKCLVHEGQGSGAIETIAATFRACVATGRELLVVLPWASDRSALGKFVVDLFARDIFPDWWALPDTLSTAEWNAIAAAVQARDPHCRGLLMLASSGEARDFAAAIEITRAEPAVRGFALGRGLFWPTAQRWFAGAIDDAGAVRALTQSLHELTTYWRKGRT